MQVTAQPFKDLHCCILYWYLCHFRYGFDPTDACCDIVVSLRDGGEMFRSTNKYLSGDSESFRVAKYEAMVVKIDQKAANIDASAAMMAGQLSERCSV